MMIKVFYGLLPDEENIQISQLHNEIFQADDNLNDKISKKINVITFVEYRNDEVVGYKMGYEINSDVFYSWLGGVKKNYRKHGVAQKLIDEQVKILNSEGYKKIQTKTFNKWKNMLILNIKNH